MQNNKFNRKLINSIIDFFDELPFPKKLYSLLLCGSSLIKNNPRDVDLFVYTLTSPKILCKKIIKKLRNINADVLYKYYENLKFYSIKFELSGTFYSLHIVSVNFLKKEIKKQRKYQFYSSLHIFDVNLNAQTVLRKWIIETHLLLGNPRIKENLIKMITNENVESPKMIAKNILIKNINNNINYFYEKKLYNDNAFIKIMQSQILNELIPLVYLINNHYFGTLPYLSSDLKTFEINKPLCELTLKILEDVSLEIYVESLGELTKRLEELH